MTEAGRDHAVVLGAGIAGLLAARVLSEHFAAVTVADRDQMDGNSAPRRGIPQARHLHGLLARGHEVLEELFPGLTDELVAAGAPLGDMLGHTRLRFGGRRFAQGPSGLTALCVSRPSLEAAIRRRVTALPGVRLRGGYDVAGLVTTADHRHVTGARVVDRREGNSRQRESKWPADLTVVATGRGSRLPAWLVDHGYAPPSIERVALGVGYASQSFRLPPGALGADLVVIAAPTPDSPRGGALSLLEGDRCLVTLIGVLGDHPSTDSEGFRRFASDVALPEFATLISVGEAVDRPARYRHPVSIRHRYDRLKAVPGDLAVLGDAVCSLNPIYGQGMTVAALQALALRRHLDERGSWNTRRYLDDVGRIGGVAWSLALAGDLIFPQVPGRRTLVGRLMGRYIARIQAGAANDPAVGRAFLRVTALLDPPGALFRPALIRRVVAAGAS